MEEKTINIKDTELADLMATIIEAHTNCFYAESNENCKARDRDAEHCKKCFLEWIRSGGVPTL